MNMEVYGENVKYYDTKMDFANDDFEVSRRVWRSIETLFNESGLPKNLRSKSGARSYYQHVIVRIFSSMLQKWEIKLENSAITLKYAMDAERICHISVLHSYFFLLLWRLMNIHSTKVLSDTLYIFAGF